MPEWSYVFISFPWNCQKEIVWNWKEKKRKKNTRVSGKNDLPDVLRLFKLNEYAFLKDTVRYHFGITEILPTHEVWDRMR